MFKIDLENAWNALVEKDGHRIKKGLEPMAKHEFKLCAQQLKTNKWDGKIVDWKISLEKCIEPFVEDNAAFFIALDAMNYVMDSQEK